MIIKGRAPQELRAFGIDKESCAIALHDRVSRLRFAESHFVMQSRASALDDADAQPLFGGVADEQSQLSHSIFGYINHRLEQSTALIVTGQAPGVPFNACTSLL